MDQGTQLASPGKCQPATERHPGFSCRFQDHFTKGHEGRKHSHGPVSVDSERFHEGRGAGKSTTPGGVEKSMLIFLEKKSCDSKHFLAGLSLAFWARTG
jgi:hypothetical protein